MERRYSVVSHIGSLQRDLATFLGCGYSVDELTRLNSGGIEVDLRDRRSAQEPEPAKGR